MSVPTADRKRALITGISGQDGSYLAELLLAKNYIVHGLSRSACTQQSSSLNAILATGCERLFLHSCNVIEHSSVCELIRSIRPQEIYNLAAQSHVGMSFKQPELTAAASGLGVLNMLEAVWEAGLQKSTRVFEASSSEIFGRASAARFDEQSPMHPQTPYGKAKLLSYLAVKHYREVNGMYTCSGILFNHESPRRGESFVTRKITQAASRIKLGQQDVLLLGNLEAERDWGHARDYVHCMWLMLQQEQPADFIIATGVNTSVRSFVELAFERAGMPLRWEGTKGLSESGVVSEGALAGKKVIGICADFFRPAEAAMTGNPSKACAKLGWKQDSSVQNLVHEMVDADMELAASLF